MPKPLIELEQLFQKYNQNLTPGIAVMIIHDQKILMREGYGLRNLSDSSPIRSNSNFNLASLSKAFTAAAIAILEERSLINTSDSIKKFFTNVSCDYAAIKIKELIYHTSGLPNYAKRHWDKEELITNEMIVDYLQMNELNSIPGERFEYNDVGYILLACLIEKITSMSYTDFLGNNIFKPCGMSNTIIYHPDKKKIPERVLGYADYPLFKLCDEHPGDMVYGDGAIYSSLDDLYLWLMAIENASIFLRQTKQKILTSGLTSNRQSIGYGYGWFIKETSGMKRYYHTGEWVGFRNCIVNLPQINLWVIVLSNSSDTNMLDIANRIIDNCQTNRN